MLEGRGAWVWYVAGCPNLVETAHRTHLSHLLIKGGDGADRWRQLTRPLVEELQAAGVRVLAWQYCYGDDPDAEADVGKALLDLGLDGLVADVEAEYEGKPRNAERYGTAVRAHAGDRLFGYSPLPVIDFHTALPYVQLNRVCDVVLPQLYTRALGAERWPLGTLFAIWDRWRATWEAWGVPSPPIAPVGETFGAATAADVHAFEAAVRARGLAAHSYWALDHATPEHLAVLADTPPTGAAASSASVTAALDRIWSETEHLAALEHRERAVAIQRHVVALKEALNLQAQTGG